MAIMRSERDLRACRAIGNLRSNLPKCRTFLSGCVPLLFLLSAAAWGQVSACDVNKDGATNIVDVQVATNNSLSCPATAYQTFVSQVITGVLTSCPVTTGIHTTTVNWTASTTSGAMYNVYRATTSGGYNYTTPLNSGPISGTSFTDCSVALGQTYFYVVKAVVGGTESVASTEITATIPAA